MSAASVCVLTPNGRRQTVKCTPNTTILQILEEVCRKQKFNPVEYDLKHHKTILDTTTTFRFSGLPNNAQLEMVTAVRTRAESNITVAVNLEDGNRLMGDFSPNDTLLNVLNQLCPQSLNEEKAPVVIYTRREIYGKELENCTLRSLGLTGGRAMIRVLHRSPEELKTQAAVAAPLPQKPVEEKPYRRTLQRLPSPPKQEVSGNEETEETEAPPDDMTDDSEKYLDTDKGKKQKYQSTGVDILKLAREKRKTTEMLLPARIEKKQAVGGNLVGKNEGSTIGVVKNNSMEVDDNDCGRCETVNTSVPDKHVEEEFIFLGSRNAMLFSLESAQTYPSEDLPDDFFELTIEDARKILKDVKKQSQGTENAPLMTAALRKLEESKKQLRQLNRYKKAIIRIQFIDRIVLQGVFAPTDTIADVMEFVREFLEDNTVKFHLYSTPPKCILDENKRLIELGFVPNALIYFGADSNEMSAGNCLRKDLQDKFTSNSTASILANKIRTENMRNCQYQDEDPVMEVDNHVIENGNPSTSSTLNTEYEGRKVIPSTENIPKWFKR